MEFDKPGTLFLVPTPIGNYADISQRAIQVLESVQVLAAEDTRETAMLLRHLGLNKRLLSYHDHNEESRARWLVEQIEQGNDVALVSDAGVPLISDPGFRIVNAAAAKGIRIVSLPGPCAAITALTGSGLPADRFQFVGFLPRQEGPRSAAIREVVDYSGTLVFYEAPHRALATLASLREVLGDRQAAIGWNLTKEKETYYRGTLSSLHDELATWEYVHGEMTLVVAGAKEGENPDKWRKVDNAIVALLEQGVEPRAIRDVLADLTELGRREIYQHVLALAKETGDEKLGT